jgi:type IV fimbrial biogenesis protein FimT
MKNAQQRGFTLVESMVTLSLVAASLSAGVPALKGVSESMRLSSAAEGYFSSLMLGRSEAIKRNARVVLCKSADGQSCTNQGRWEQGWLVFHDVNNNARIEAGESLLARQQALPAGVRLSGNQPVASYVSYTPLGSTSTTGGGFQAGTFTLCNNSASKTEAREIVIASSGRPRSRKISVASCA